MHWKKYGRSFFSRSARFTESWWSELIPCRYDYEECESEGAEAMMAHLRKLFASSDFAGSKLKATSSDTSFEVASADDFSYKDPIDGSVSTKQGESASSEIIGRRG